MNPENHRARRGRPGSWTGLALAVALVWLGPDAAVRAQSEDCASLRQQMAAAADPGRATQFTRAAQRQQSELTRTRAYSDQIGCGGLFSIFSDAPSSECKAIEAQIRRMENNLNLLESQAERAQGGNADRQASLASRYDASCGISRGTPTDPYGWDTDVNLDADGFDAGAQPDDGEPRVRGGKAICVRTCDGGYFPLGEAGSGEGAANLQRLCSALCPNAEAKLYTTPNTDDLNTAVAIDGTPYTSLPAAFQFQKSFDATCTCKPPGKSWVEALAQAETLLEKSDKDVTVTLSMSDAMAKPTAATAVSPRRKGDKKTRVDVQAAENALGAQAPTASTDSAGIATGAGTQDRVVKTGEGAVKEVAGPDGAKRRVRIIGPLL